MISFSLEIKVIQDEDVSAYDTLGRNLMCIADQVYAQPLVYDVVVVRKDDVL